MHIVYALYIVFTPLKNIVLFTTALRKCTNKQTNLQLKQQTQQQQPGQVLARANCCRVFVRCYYLIHSFMQSTYTDCLRSLAGSLARDFK